MKFIRQLANWRGGITKADIKILSLENCQNAKA